MMLIYSLFIVLGITSTVSALGRCFQLTWDNEGKLGKTCSNRTASNRPCFLPIVTVPEGTIGPPDVYDIWNTRNKTAFSCPLTGSNACIKYSYIVGDAVEYISYFCGKMIENNKSEITTGCYTSQVSVYTIEACACVTLGDNNTRPCNLSSRLHIAKILLIILASISVIGDNRFYER